MNVKIIKEVGSLKVGQIMRVMDTWAFGVVVIQDGVKYPLQSPKFGLKQNAEYRYVK